MASTASRGMDASSATFWRIGVSTPGVNVATSPAMVTAIFTAYAAGGGAWGGGGEGLGGGGDGGGEGLGGGGDGGGEGLGGGGDGSGEVDGGSQSRDADWQPNPDPQQQRQ